MKLKDITFENKNEMCPKCKIPLMFEGWIIKGTTNFLKDIIFLLFTPKMWINGYYYKCDKCKHIYEERFDEVRK